MGLFLVQKLTCGAWPASLLTIRREAAREDAEPCRGKNEGVPRRAGGAAM